MFLAIEGVDGVGKTTTAKAMAKRLECVFVEKPFRLLLDGACETEAYYRISGNVNQCSNNVRAWFYGTGMLCLSERYNKESIVVDRYFLSNFAWNGSSDNMNIFDALYQQVRIPDLTVVLTASDETVFNRLRNRNKNDLDFANINMNYIRTKNMLRCLSRYDIPNMIISTDELTTDQICDRIGERIKTLSYI